MSVGVHIYVSICHISVVAHRSQRRVLELLKPEFQAVVSFLTWMVGTELGSSRRAGTLLTGPSLYLSL